jgi:hypothetical protein
VQDIDPIEFKKKGRTHLARPGAEAVCPQARPLDRSVTRSPDAPTASRVGGGPQRAGRPILPRAWEGSVPRLASTCPRSLAPHGRTLAQRLARPAIVVRVWLAGFPLDRSLGSLLAGRPSNSRANAPGDAGLDRPRRDARPRLGAFSCR